MRHAVRALCEGHFVSHFGLLGVGDEGRCNGRVDPHAALAFVVQRQDFVEAVGRRPGRAVFGQQVHIKGDGFFPRLGFELRLPGHVKPLRAKAVGHGGEECHVVAPARLAAQADAVHAIFRVVDFGGRIAHIVPGRTVGELDTGFVGQVFAVHQHGAFTVERRSVHLAVHAQAVAHGGQDVIGVVAGVALELGQPAFFAPDGRLIHADGHDVELTTLGGDVRRHALAQHAFFERDPFQGDARVGGFKVLAELFHLDHVAVVHGGNDQLDSAGRSAPERGDQGCRKGKAEFRFHRQSPVGLGWLRRVQRSFAGSIDPRKIARVVHQIDTQALFLGTNFRKIPRIYT